MNNQDVITQAIGIMANEDKETLVKLLQKSGSMVTSMSSQKELLDASFRALKDSASFRNDLSNYLTQQASGSFSNYVGDDFFANAVGKTKRAKFDPKTGTGGTGVGNLLRSVFSKENIDTAVKTGIGIAATKLQSKASKEGEQRAIDFETAKAASAAAAAAEAEAKKAAAEAGVGGKKTPKWVLPVAIGGGLLVIGAIVFFATRKK
jgi:hypothetical protein